MAVLELPDCPVCKVKPGKNGRPLSRVRPDIRLSVAYTSKIGAECGEIAEVIDRAAAKIHDAHLERELAMAAEKLMRLKVLFQ